MPEATARLVSWLQERHTMLKSCEQLALMALNFDNNKQAYQALMQERAEQIAALRDEAAPLLESLPQEKRNTAEEALDRFSTGAENALRLESVFYMSALLYPDDHKQGEPDNMECLISQLSE